MTPSKLNDFDEHPSEAEMEVHPMVSLLVARMESNPQEFYRYDPSRGPVNTAANGGRMATHINQTIEHTKALWNRKEKRLFNIALRKVRMGEAHERLMALLLADK